MNISIDSDGNVSLNRTFDTSNIETIVNKLETIFDTIKAFDETQIEAAEMKMNELYFELANFQIFLDEWQEILNEVVL